VRMAAKHNSLARAKVSAVVADQVVACVEKVRRDYERSPSDKGYPLRALIPWQGIL
jgi:hypothetical protein